MKPSEVLRDAAKLVKRGWCRNGSAMSKSGHAVMSWSRAATQWCALGAINRAAKMPSDKYRHVKLEACTVFRKIIGQESIVGWNDHGTRTAEEVALKLEEAATISERSGG